MVNLDELVMEGEFGDGEFRQRYGSIASEIGAKKLGYNLTVVPPGKKAVPYHNHPAFEPPQQRIKGTGLVLDRVDCFVRLDTVLLPSAE